MRVEAAYEMLLDLRPPCLTRGEGGVAPLLARLEDLRDARGPRGRSREEHPGGEVDVGSGLVGKEARRERAERRRRRSLRRMEGSWRRERRGWRRSLGGREGRESGRMRRRSEVATASPLVLVRGLRCPRRGGGRRGREEGPRGMHQREGEDGRGPCRAGHGAERGVGKGARCNGRAVGGIPRVPGAVAR